MSTLSTEEIAQHAYNAGFRGDDLATAVAIATAESSNDPGQHNGVGLDDSYGLWQINMLGDMGPARREQFGLESNDELFDPATNAKAAYEIYDDRGKTFQDWSTFQNGEYEKHLDEARKAVKEIQQDDGKDHQNPSGDGDKPPSGGDRGFAADTEQLTTYTKTAEAVADELANVGKRTVHKVRGIAENSFGAVGKETGFSEALANFSAALEKQVKATGSKARELGEATSEAAKTYREADEEAIRALKNVMGA